MSSRLCAALIGAALLTSTSSAVFALEGIDGDGNPVPNNVEVYPGYSGGYAYQAFGPGVPLRAPTRAERRALTRGYEVR